MKFAYGVSDFKKIVTHNYFYKDRTDRIPLLEQSESQLFIRPRRFGKSLLLSMLENYYDVAKKDEFERLFGHLAIGKNPTPLRNSYFILKLDFSCVDPTGSADDIKGALFDHINDSIKRFILYYRKYDLAEIDVNRDNAISSISSLLSSTSITPYPVFLFIDEYDNFANTVMMGMQRLEFSKGTKKEGTADELRYQSLVHEHGPLRTFFKSVKASTSGSMFDRVFITGVSPVVMSDITSGYNIAENIYFEPEFNDLCGFTQSEIEHVIEQIVKQCNWHEDKIIEAVDLMKIYYNGYRFSHTKNEYIYNPTLSLYFFKQFQKSCNYPRRMLDANLAADESKLEYIAALPNGRDILMHLMEKDQEVVISEIQDRFGIQDMISDSSMDHTFLVSFLYYFGVLTISEDTKHLKSTLKVPNLVMKSLYVDRICKMLLPWPTVR
ncbi:MAG: AAA family ATPase, partial [Desulfamplus sp.]|nr:AAA family ATPase [Desulfamplus sp.]